MEGGGRLHSEIHNIRTKAVPFAPFYAPPTVAVDTPVGCSGQSMSIKLGMSLIHNWYEALGYINEQTEIQARAYNLLGN